MGDTIEPPRWATLPLFPYSRAWGNVSGARRAGGAREGCGVLLFPKVVFECICVNLLPCRSRPQWLKGGRAGTSLVDAFQLTQTMILFLALHLCLATSGTTSPPEKDHDSAFIHSRFKALGKSIETGNGANILQTRRCGRSTS